MAGNGWKVLKLVGNVMKWLEMTENGWKLSENSLKGFEMAGNCQNNLEIVENGWTFAGSAWTCWNWLEIAGNG